MRKTVSNLNQTIEGAKNSCGARTGGGAALLS